MQSLGLLFNYQGCLMGEVPVLGLLQLETWASSAGFSHGLTWGSVWVETLGQVQLLSGWGCC